jgi:hypothetical protein
MLQPVLGHDPEDQRVAADALRHGRSKVCSRRHGREPRVYVCVCIRVFGCLLLSAWAQAASCVCVCVSVCVCGMCTYIPISFSLTRAQAVPFLCMLNTGTGQ